MTVFEIVKSKTYKIQGVTDGDINIAISEVEHLVKNYCNIVIIPEELNFTCANMAVDLLKTEFINDNDMSQVASLKIGDTTVNMRDSSNAHINSVVRNYHTQLNRFRKMVW